MSYVIRDTKTNMYFQRSFFKNKAWQHDFTALLQFAKKFSLYGEAVAKRSQINQSLSNAVLAIDQEG